MSRARLMGFDSYRPTPSYPTYPPYHVGYYLEDYFYHNYADLIPAEVSYIPVFWTTCYIENKTNGLQKALDDLDKSKKYFTVSQHDDAIKERLPPHTKMFSAGGNVRDARIIPIPLVCSPIPPNYIRQDHRSILASFVGSNTHPIRLRLCNEYKENKNFIISNNAWSPNVSTNSRDHFLQIASQSVFMLCPRGYGLNSFRLYESFQLGCIPVIISDQMYLPWQDEVNWTDIAVIIREEEIATIESRLIAISKEVRNSMVEAGKEIYSKYFTLDAVCENIIKRLK